MEEEMQPAGITAKVAVGLEVDMSLLTTEEVLELLIDEERRLRETQTNIENQRKELLRRLVLNADVHIVKMVGDRNVMVYAQHTVRTSKTFDEIGIIGAMTDAEKALLTEITRTLRKKPFEAHLSGDDDFAKRMGRFMRKEEKHVLVVNNLDKLLKMEAME